MWPLGGIFAYSGGAPVNVDAINAAPVHTVDENEAGALVRNEPSQPPRDAPHNLYGLGPELFALGGEPVPPKPLFEYLANGAAARDGAGHPRVPRRLRGRVRPDVDVGRRHRYLEAVDRRGAPDRRRRYADRTGQRGGAVHAVRRRGGGADRRRGRRVDLHRRHGAAPVDGCAPTRPSRRATSTPRGRPSRCGPDAPGSSCCRPGAWSTSSTRRRPPPRSPPVTDGPADDRQEEEVGAHRFAKARYAGDMTDRTTRNRPDRHRPRSSGASPRCCAAASSWTSSRPSRPRSPKTPARSR